MTLCVRQLDRAAGLDGTPKRKLVGILQVAAHGQAARQTRHLNTQRLDGTGEVARRGLALDIGVGGDNDLVDILVTQARQQLADMQLLGADFVHGADHAAQHVVQAMIAARALDPEDVDMLQDMIMAAVNEAVRGVNELANKQMGAITGGLNIPGMPF